MENVKSKFINNKKVVIFIAVILLILLIFVIIPMAKVSTMRKEMENYELMEYAELSSTVFFQKIAESSLQRRIALMFIMKVKLQSMASQNRMRDTFIIML